MKIRKPSFLKDMGLTISGGAMAYGWNHGALRWAPEWVKRSICTAWNAAHCAVAGHDPLAYTAYTSHTIPGPPVCFSCCARLKIDGRHPTPEEVEAHDTICYRLWEEAEEKWRRENPELAAEQDKIKDDVHKQMADTAAELFDVED